MIVRLAGDPVSQGRRHAAAIPDDLRRDLLALVARHRPGAHSAALLAMAARHAPETVGCVEGLSRGLDVPVDRLWAYTVRGYVSDAAGDGCSVAARAGREPILGKNRDFSLAHASLQALFVVHPESGYPWVSLGSLGSPGVYSSGMNAAGLAVADAHVATQALGPGLLRGSLMQQVVERYADVPSAVAHLERLPSAHGGMVALADARGRAACVELAHGRTAARRPSDHGWVVATNHFRHPRMHRLNRPSSCDDARTSRPRADRLSRLAARTDSALDLLAALASHEGGAGRLCRHEYGAAGDRATLASIVFRPAARDVLLRSGRPCEVPTLRMRWTGRTFETG